NWSPFAVYNPQLWHWPEDWPLVSISPTVEPFLVIGYIMFYLGPYFPPIWILIDAMLEITLVRTGFYIYAQVIPFGSVFTGQPYQFPFIWETVMVTFVM